MGPQRLAAEAPQGNAAEVLRDCMRPRPPLRRGPAAPRRPSNERAERGRGPRAARHDARFPINVLHRDYNVPLRPYRQSTYVHATMPKLTLTRKTIKSDKVNTCEWVCVANQPAECAHL